MQHKRQGRARALFVILALMVIGGAVVLMTVNVPAPLHAIEKPLDAKAFLEQKQS